MRLSSEKRGLIPIFDLQSSNTQTERTNGCQDQAYEDLFFQAVAGTKFPNRNQEVHGHKHGLHYGEITDIDTRMKSRKVEPKNQQNTDPQDNGSKPEQ